MKTGILILLAMAGTIGLTTAAEGAVRSHSELKRAYNAYQNPDYRVRPLPERAAAPEQKRNEELFRLIELQKQWELKYAEDISKPEAALADPVLVQKLAALSQDELQQRLSEKTDLPTMLALTALKNPGLKAADNRYRAAMEKFSQAFDLDETLNQYRTFTRDLKVPFGPMNHTDPIGEDYPVPGVTTLKAEAIDQDVRIQSLRYSAVLRDLKSDVIKAYEQWVFLDHAIRIDQENLNLFRKLEESAQVKYNTGRSGYNAVIQAQIRIDRLVTELKDLGQNRDQAAIRLLKLVDLPEVVRLGPPVSNPAVSLSDGLPDLIRMGLEGKQEVEMARASARKMELMIQMSEKMVVPQSASLASIFNNQMVSQVGTEAGQPTFPTRPMTSPKFFFGTRSAYIREMKGNLLALNQEVIRQENLAVDLITQAYTQYENAARERRLFEDSLLDLADQSVKVSQAEYVSNLIDFPELLDSHNRILEFRIGYYRTLRDQNQAYAELERTVGLPLPRKE
jgi:outer membrane protein TolC